MKAIKSPRAAKLSTPMTETEFDNGYWYADDLKKFAEKIGVPSARRLRKDELEQAVRHFLRTGEARSFARRTPDEVRAERHIPGAADRPPDGDMSAKELVAFLGVAR